MLITMPINNQSCYLLQKIDNMRPSNPLSIILDNNRLTGLNFIDWLRNLKVVLDSEKILYVIEQSLPLSLPENSSPKEYEVLIKWKDDDMQARCIMWASMMTEIHQQHEKYNSAREIYFTFKSCLVKIVGPLDMRYLIDFSVLR